jgi:hypothetical protein
VGLRAAFKSSIENKKIEEHKRKPMHGQFYWHLWETVRRERRVPGVVT